MATISFAATGLTSKSYTLSAGDTQRVLDAMKATYGAALTNQQAFDQFAANSMQALKDLVKRVEGDSAATTARAGVADVVAI